MERSDKEESNAKCHICSNGLLYLEHRLYGNRCTFHAERVLRIDLIKFLIGCFYDWHIYQQLIRLREAKGEEGRVYLLGCLGVIGCVDINQVHTISKKKALLAELKACGRSDEGK